MASNFKFIHAADIHLGSNLHIRQKLNKDLVNIIDNAVYESLERVFNMAISEKANFILLSGDIYDRDSRSVKANSFFVKQCWRLKDENIEVFIIGGNHDPARESSEYFKMPSNVHILSAEKADIFELKDYKENVYCRVIGQSYRDTSDSRRIFENYKLIKDNIFTIAMLHTQLDKSNNYIPCTFSDLKAIENIDYWALGHIHKPQVINGQAPYAIYPGIPQGRDSGEEGIGGAVLIEASDKKINDIKFIKTSPIIWKNVIINLKDLDIKNFSDLEGTIINSIEELTSIEKVELSGFNCWYHERWSLTKGYIINLNIAGRGEIYEQINEKEEEAEEALIENLNSKLIKKHPFIYVNSIEFYVGKPIGPYEEFLNDNEMIKSIDLIADKCLEDEALKNQLSKRLGAIWEETKDKEDLNIKKLQLDEDMYEVIISQAKQLIIDLLLERGEK